MTNTSIELDEEIQETKDLDLKYYSLISRLSKQSVDKHFNAYEDVDWDAEEMQIELGKGHWTLTDGQLDPIGSTQWYQGLDDLAKDKLGLYSVAIRMKFGLQFESILKRGLLEYAFRLPNNSPEFRYAYHEVIEEAQHSLMFQEFVNRTKLDIPGLTKLDLFGTSIIVKLGAYFPALFFFFVLGGEDPIDYVQRKALRMEKEIHPLLQRIMKIHVTEEARHLSFARHYLQLNVPKLGFVRKTTLSIAVPIILGTMAQMMLQAPRQVVKEFNIPQDVLKEAYKDNELHHVETRNSLNKVRNLYEELNLMTPVSKRIWKLFNIL